MSCDICLSEARGLNFGAFSCRACAAFFRRTVRLQLTFSCLRDSNCDVTKKKRFSCRYCRFEKCRAKGMNPSLVSFSEIEALLQEESSTPPLLEKECMSGSAFLPEYGLHHGSHQDSFGDELPNANPMHNILLPSGVTFIERRELVKQHIDKLFDQKQCEMPVELNVFQQTMLALNEYNKKWPNCAPGKIRKTQSCEISRCVERKLEETVNIAEFCMSLQEFSQLPKDQKWLLFHSFWPRFAFLERYVTTLKADGDMLASHWLSYDGELVDLSVNSENSNGMISENEARRIFEVFLPMCLKGMQLVGNQLKKVKPSTFEIIFCLLQTLWGVGVGDGITTKTAATARSVRQQLAKGVHNYYVFDISEEDHAGRIMKLMNIVSALDELEQQREEEKVLVRTFRTTKMDVFVDYV